MFIVVCTCERCLQCHRVFFWGKVIRGNSGFTFQTFAKLEESVIPFQFWKDAIHDPFLKGIIPSYKR